MKDVTVMSMLNNWIFRQLNKLGSNNVVDFPSTLEDTERLINVKKEKVKMEEISVYYFKNDENKQAVVVKEETGYLRNKGYYVHIRENGKTIKVINVTEHSLRYAEDTAENYATGIAK